MVQRPATCTYLQGTGILDKPTVLQTLKKKKAMGKQNEMRSYFSVLSKRPNFKYEILGHVGDITFDEWQEDGSIQTYPKCNYLIKSLGGSKSFSDTFICTLCGSDALKHLREGEIISAKLKFSAKKNNNGSYEQHVVAEDVITLNDFYQNREIIAAHEGEMKGKAEAAA